MIQKVKLEISGVHCSGCVHFLTKVLTVEGIHSKDLDSSTGIASIQFNDQFISSEKIIDLINQTETYHVKSVQSVT